MSKSVFAEKFLIPNCRGLSVKQSVFYFFEFYSKTSLRIFPIFCMGVEVTSAHCMSKNRFEKKVLIPDYKRLSVQKRYISFFTSVHFTPKRLQGSSQVFA